MVITFEDASLQLRIAYDERNRLLKEFKSLPRCESEFTREDLIAMDVPPEDWMGNTRPPCYYLGDHQVSREHWCQNCQTRQPVWETYRRAAHALGVAKKAFLRADIDPRHIIDLAHTGWALQHPLSCRPNLLDCAFHTVTSKHFYDVADPSEYTGLEGRFLVELTADAQFLRITNVRAD